MTETQRTISDWGNQTFQGPHPALVMALRMNVEVAELLTELVALYPTLEHSPLALLIHANSATAEALNALHGTVPGHPTAGHPTGRAKGECADIAIMNFQVIDSLAGVLTEEVDRKMAINRHRIWGRTASGKMQHVPLEAMPNDLLGDLPMRALEPGERVRYERTTELPTVVPMTAALSGTGGFPGYAISASHGPLTVAPYDSKLFRDVGTGIVMDPDLYYIVSDSGSAYSAQGFPTVLAAREWMRLPEQVADYSLTDLDVIWPKYLGPEAGWENMAACNIVKGDDCKTFFQHQDPEGWKLMNPVRGDEL